jgi:hypothetical protein
MANRFFNPNQQFCDATGLPYAGGSLTFYASGTTTPLNTYSDKALSIANTNPVVLDSAGRAGSIFLQNLAYKVVLADVNSNQIWTFDPVYSSDFSTVAQFQSGNGSPNGFVAGSAGSATIPASAYWDAQGDILYICTQTGNAATAVWTAINAGSTANVNVPPQGYLTPVSGTPIITSDAIGATTVYYTPYVGDLIGIYNGTTIVPTTFSELSLTLVSAHAASTIYDVFVFNNNGVLTLVTGPAWASSTPGSCSRGSGAGTTQISRIAGLWFNTVSMTGRNGSTTYTIPANQASYLGSIFIDSTSGQVSCHRSYGQSRKWGIWNAFNRVPIVLKAGDPTASWTYNTSTIRASNGNTANSLTIFSGLAEDYYSLFFTQNVGLSTNGGANLCTVQVGIGYNVTNAFAGKATVISETASASLGTQAISADFFSEYLAPPALGINTVTSLEDTVSAGNGVTYFGLESRMILSARWNA